MSEDYRKLEQIKLKLAPPNFVLADFDISVPGNQIESYKFILLNYQKMCEIINSILEIISNLRISMDVDVSDMNDSLFLNNKIVPNGLVRLTLAGKGGGLNIDVNPNVLNPAVGQLLFDIHNMLNVATSKDKKFPDLLTRLNIDKIDFKLESYCDEFK